MSTLIEPKELGRRIRRLRLERRLTLKRVEQLSGLSATHLSEIERGHTSPTIGALIRIARSLGKDPSYLIEAEERPDVARVEHGRGRALEFGEGMEVEALTPGIPGNRIFVYRLRIDRTKGAELHLDPRDCPAEAVYWVRRGELEAMVGKNRLRLSAGDAFQASLAVIHRIKATSNEAPEVIAILTRPLEDAVSKRFSSGTREAEEA